MDNNSEEKYIASQPDFYHAFQYWLKLGFISFGGPAGQISMMHQELVERRKWISEKRFLHALNYTMILPGPEAQQLATYIGWLMHGVWGGLAAGLLFILPSFFILLLLSWGYLNYGDLPWVQGILYGIKPAVTAIILFAAYRIGKKALHHKALKMIALFAFSAIFFFDVPFPLIILSAALMGYGLSFWQPRMFDSISLADSKQDQSRSAVINDNDATPKHALLYWPKIIMIITLGLFVWLGFLLLLILHFGTDSVFSQMALFFSKAALLTFGGAYAVLPYVFQAGVEHYQWISPEQMIDGLALGESTPGPLIMIVTYIGFIGGWAQTIWSGEHAELISAITAAGIVTFVTFLPSFLFIFIGGPFVEASREKPTLRGPLTAITAAVVGVIVSLALFFAYHVLWPQGVHNVSVSQISSTMDGFALFLIGTSGFLLYRFQFSLIALLSLAAITGVIYTFLF